MDELLAAARSFDKRALGKLITLVEDPRSQAAGLQLELETRLASASAAVTIGITGAPGVGKSTLVSALCSRLLSLQPELRLAVVAVDPSSSLSGGSLLGDRTRLGHLPAEQSRRLFFRSQPSSLELGGLSPRTYVVVQTLVGLADMVVVESVGVGQSELDIFHLSDLSMLLVGPHSGDAIQLMKAGIMEMPDLLVAAKSDLLGPADAARLARATDSPTLEISARTGAGLDSLVSAIAETASPSATARTARADYFFRRWVARTYGSVGLEAAEAEIAPQAGYQPRVSAFEAAFAGWLQSR